MQTGLGDTDGDLFEEDFWPVHRLVGFALRLTPLCDRVELLGAGILASHVSASKSKKAIRLQNGWLGLTGFPSA